MIGEADSSISIDIPATNYTIASYNLNKKYDALDHLECSRWMYDYKYGASPHSLSLYIVI